ncbi:sigma-54-dependent Fis family transcriptional regulator, partial [Candidatus Sumerlaeota bacterium]|nr:sigma-54-dependent Fis family transcriptional regulator [Candidatus Sumerlaeota bacterium]
PEALAALEEYVWSGNIRELQNVLEHTVVLNEGERVSLEMLPKQIRGEIEPAGGGGTGARPRASAPGIDGLRPFWQVERDEIQRALDLCDGNVQEVARRLEISAATLYRKIEKYGLVK